MALLLNDEQKLALDAAWDRIIKTAGQIPNGLPMSLADSLSGTGLAGNVVTYRPGETEPANGIVTTWAEVHAIAEAAQGPWTLYIDDSIEEAQVPSGANTDFHGYTTIDIVYGQSGGRLVVKDGALIKNFLNLQNGGIWVEAFTTHGIQFDQTGLRVNIREGGIISNVDNATVAAIRVPIDFFVIASINSGAISNAETGAEPTVPMLEFTSTNNGFFVIAQIGNTRAGATAITANNITGDATATIFNIHDTNDRLTAQSGFAGTITAVPVAFSAYLNWSNGDTASRPSTVMVGQMYFDTDLGKPIWWNGSGWILADGTSA